MPYRRRILGHYAVMYGVRRIDYHVCRIVICLFKTNILSMIHAAYASAFESVPAIIFEDGL